MLKNNIKVNLDIWKQLVNPQSRNKYLRVLARCSVWAVIAGVAAAGIAGAQVAGGHRSENEIWGAAGDVRLPANRAAVVAELRLLGEARKAAAVERARLLGLPVRVELPTGGALELMAWNGEHPMYYTTFNANAAISTGSNLIRVSPYLADGAGATVGIWDAGSVRSTHQEFGGRVTVMDGAAVNNHSTHVGGTIAAAGITASAGGMARAVRIDSYDWNSDVSEMSSRGASYGGEPGKIYVSNHSYGYSSGWVYTTSPAYTWYGSGTTAAGYEDDFGKYHSVTRDLDTRAYNLPYYSIFWAAGNDRGDNPSTGMKVALSSGGTIVDYDPVLHPAGDGVYRSGYDTISYAGLAKNVISVGAVNDAVTTGVRDLAKATMTTFSVWGPTDDGRIKPDLVANGFDLYSTSSGGDASYTTMRGTSMASPNAAGTAQQLLGYYTSLLPGQYLRSSTLKGLLIHTADDLGTAGPDYKFGWGLINAKAAADLLAAVAATPAVPRMMENQLSTSVTTRTHSFTWNGVSPIRATLCWTDPAGASTTAHDSRVVRLVNNLNLRIVGPTGTQHFPYVMPFVDTWTVASMSAAAATGTNNTDNVEQVYIAAPPAAGTYQAIVSYSGSLSNTSQNYSLLFSGSAPSAPTPHSVSPDSAETGNVTLTITGESFATGAAVTFFHADHSDVEVEVSAVTSTTIDGMVDVTAMAKGLWGVRVTNPDGKSGTLQGAFAVVGTLWGQTFDVDAAGWSSSVTLGTGGSGWMMTEAQSHTPAKSYFITPPSARKTDNLISTGIAISPSAQRLHFHFWHKHNTESYDGCLLELSPDGGTTWQAIGAAGSGTSFVAGGYASNVQGRGGNPNNRSEFFGKPAWTGNNGSSFTEVIVAFNSAVYAGATMKARWRLGSDSANDTGTWYWYVDSVRISGYDTSNLAPTLVAPAAANPATVTVDSTVLSVLADDDGGEAALIYSWTVNDSPDYPVSFSDNGNNAAKQTTATFNEAGAYSFVVTVRDNEGLTATSAVAVAVQAVPTFIVVSPASAEVEAGQAQQFSATAHDQFAQPLVPQPMFAWSVSGGGTIDNAGLFTAGQTAGGPHTVTAAALGLEGTAQTMVLEPPPVYWVLGVEASPAEGGSVTGAGVYEDGTSHAVTATPSKNWIFAGWTGSGIADTSALSTTVLVDAEKTVTAHFIKLQPTVIRVQ